MDPHCETKTTPNSRNPVSLEILYMSLFRPAAAWSTLLLVSLAPFASAQEAKTSQVASSDVQALSAIWDTARKGDLDKLDAQLAKLDNGEAHPAADVKAVSDAAGSLSAHIAQREKNRAARITEVRADLDKALGTNPETDISLSKGLRSTIELHMLSLDKDGLLAEPAIKTLIEHAARRPLGRPRLAAMR